MPLEQKFYLKEAEFVFASIVRNSALDENISALLKDRAESYDLKSRFLLSFSLNLPSFLGGKRKGKENNQGRDFKSCLSA